MTVDVDGLAGRVLSVPVAESRYESLRALAGGLAWLREPVIGVLGEGAAVPDGSSPGPSWNVSTWPSARPPTWSPGWTGSRSAATASGWWCGTALT